MPSYAPTASISKLSEPTQWLLPETTSNRSHDCRIKTLLRFWGIDRDWSKRRWQQNTSARARHICPSSVVNTLIGEVLALSPLLLHAFQYIVRNSFRAAPERLLGAACEAEVYSDTLPRCTCFICEVLYGVHYLIWIDFFRTYRSSNTVLRITFEVCTTI